jgi:hypothetical protein
MKSMKGILLVVTLLCTIIITGCQSKEDIAPTQDNGLNYVFVDYIGPDSCKLYRCAYHEPGHNSAGDVFLTVCKDKPSTVNWVEQHGKTTDYYSNDVVSDKTIDSIKRMKVVDTVITMVSKMVPETSLVVKFKDVKVKK